MSNLLEFQRSLLNCEVATFNLETSELNPKGIVGKIEKFESRREYKRDSYSIGTLRKFILDNSEVLATAGNVIQGKIEDEVVKLTVLKIN